jgi:hypothetical protein
VTSEPGKAQNVNHEPDYGVVAYLKEIRGQHYAVTVISRSKAGKKADHENRQPEQRRTPALRLPPPPLEPPL